MLMCKYSTKSPFNDTAKPNLIDVTNNDICYYEFLIL